MALKYNSLSVLKLRRVNCTKTGDTTEETQLEEIVAVSSLASALSFGYSPKFT
jgi:hypothetical protein